jgi:hypothetical protein
MSPERTFCSITGSWPSWAPGELVDLHRAVAAGGDLLLEHVAGEAVARGLGLIVTEAELAHVLRLHG